jgi:glycosyltransferase involved in cell wall biosynthesis
MVGLTEQLMNKVLVVTYYWPPAGGISVQRTLKFCRYLRTWGWEPIVLTVENGNFQVLDESLLTEVADVRKVYRAPSLEPHGLHRLLARSFGRKASPSGTSPPLPASLFWRLGEYIRLNLFIPDARIGWRRRALKKGGEAIVQERPDVILSTAPPYTSHLIAMELKRRFRLPWVADFRDLWVENHAYNTVPRLGIVKAVNSLLERRVLENADRVVCANPGIMKLTSAKLSAPAEHKFTVIPNGYDAREVRPLSKGQRRFTLSHFGTFYPRGFPMILFEAFREIGASEKGFTEDFLFRVQGTVDTGVAALLSAAVPRKNLAIHPFAPHDTLLESLYVNQVLLLAIPEFQANFAHVPGKFYEYLPTGNPIIGVGPKGGDADALFSETGAGQMFDYHDKEGIKQFLIDQYRLWKEGALGTGPRAFPKYDRERLTESLSRVLNALVSPPHLTRVIHERSSREP